MSSTNGGKPTYMEWSMFAVAIASVVVTGVQSCTAIQGLNAQLEQMNTNEAETAKRQIESLEREREESLRSWHRVFIAK